MHDVGYSLDNYSDLGVNYQIIIIIINVIIIIIIYYE